jgi:hypothetical protein
VCQSGESNNPDGIVGRVVGTRAEEILEAGSSTDNALAAVTNSTNHCPKTRLQSGIRNPKVYNNGTIRYGCFTSTVSLNN